MYIAMKSAPVARNTFRARQASGAGKIDTRHYHLARATRNKSALSA